MDYSTYQIKNQSLLVEGQVDLKEAKDFPASKKLAHLNREWDLLGWPRNKEQAENKDDFLQLLVYRMVSRLLNEFHKQGHSGSSAPYVLDLFNKAAKFQPLSPLTGHKDEWESLEKHGDKELLQNVRCSHVFKNKRTGRAFDIEGKIFRDQQGNYFTNNHSSVEVNFPYTPKRVYVNV